LRMSGEEWNRVVECEPAFALFLFMVRMEGGGWTGVARDVCGVLRDWLDGKCGDQELWSLYRKVR
jgi:hypothetical protein